MIELKQKIQKIKPIIRARKASLDQETISLNSIKQKKLKALGELDYHQHQYIRGVDTLNQERQTQERKRLSALELSVDTAKSRWYQALRSVREIEDQEKNQLAIVLQAQQELRSVEILEENYVNDYKRWMKKQEQKVNDEISTQKFNLKRR